MEEIIINKGVKWINISSPKNLDIEFLRKTYNFHPIVIDELLHSSDRSKVESYENYLYLVLHLPNYDSNTRSARQAEIDVLITKDSFITIHYEKLEPIEQLEKYLTNEKIKSHITNTGQLLHRLLGEIDNFSLRQLKHIEEKVKQISKNLFRNRERELLEEICHVKRDLAAFGIITWPERNILESLINSGTNFWGEKMRIYFNDALGDHWRVIHTLNNLKETLAAFEETNSQLLNFKTNEIMKFLTIIAFLTLPLTLFASLLQTRIVGDFFGQRPVGALLLIVSAFIISIVLAVHFKKRKWL